MKGTHASEEIRGARVERALPWIDGAGSDRPDLETYLHRIAYSGPREPTLETLRALHARHAEAIPFENLNPVLGWPVRLDLPSLEQKLVRNGRGGYCFEHNLLLGHVLSALGFAVTGLAARVHVEGAVTGRTHMLLCVRIEGRPYLADVGFGGQTPPVPLRLETEVEQATPLETYRLLENGGEYELQAEIRGAWRPLYGFDLQPQNQRDYEIASWYTSTHPDSHFLEGVLAARATPAGRHGLRHTEVSLHRADGETERRSIDTVEDLRDTLRTVFRIAVPEDPEVDAAFRSLLARAPAS